MKLGQDEMATILELPEAARGPAMALWIALSGQDKKELTNLLGAVRRAARKRQSDRDTDLQRRVLVGPRLPRWMVDRYRSAAEARGQSLYRWATEALEAHLAEQDEDDHYMTLMTDQDGPTGDEGSP